MFEASRAGSVIDAPGLDAAGLRHYLEASQPVRIPGVAAGWPALQRWSPEHLLGLALRSPSANVPVRRTPRDRLELDIKDVHAGHMELARFMTEVLLTPDEDELYMAGVTVSGFAPFAAEFERPSVLAGFPCVGPSLFAGRNTRCLGHYHARTQAVLVQVQGRKQVLLYSPDQCSELGLISAHQQGFTRSRINFHADPTLDEALVRRFPGLRRARVLAVWLEPGDALFIPLHWLHVPWGPDWSVSLTWWWRAALQHWSLPKLGARTAVGVATEYARRKLRRVVAPGAHE
ncbi:hypothetical protein DB30_07344 [Enhygromyxa salina]|uniref:Cupin-like domain-containing protein n=1 Tax=Enhygromyxa salina TaxID=215803 RepID=A0A0C2D1G6_9BACT|nr:cupin-like domain-containing protein [Enhygromyxa salina]KIG14007.1 hypothetical protein DB30_07344 [Enhygromyxa salina]